MVLTVLVAVGFDELGLAKVRTREPRCCYISYAPTSPKFVTESGANFTRSLCRPST